MQENVGHYISSIPRKLLLKYEPQQAWLQHDSWVHGVDHMTRVFILQELICNKLEKNGENINRVALRWAAATHDVGRIDDGLDLMHGIRSAEWIKTHLAHMMKAELLDLVAYLVEWHVPDDQEAPEMTVELSILKDADALDRVRLGDLDASYLRTPGAIELIDTANNLYRESLKFQDKNGQISFIGVVNAAKSLEIVL